MCTQPNVIEALREAEAALELAIRRILKRDPGHHVEVTSEAKALVSVRQALQCQGCDVPKDGVYQISEPSHSMSQYASKDDMLKAVMAENEQLKVQLAAAQQGVQVLNVSQATIDFLKDSLQDCDDSARDVAVAHDIEKILLAATTTATQGLDAKAYTMSIERAGGVASVKIPVLKFSNARLQEQLLGAEALGLIQMVDAALAAQAKQGGV